jgi:ABC-type transport system substrate-binding protein
VFNDHIGVRWIQREFVVILTRTVRGLLTSGLLLGLGASVSVATGLAATSMKGTARSELRSAKDGGTLIVGADNFDYIDPALLLDGASNPATSTALAMWAVADTTCATLFRYPVGPPLKQDYGIVPEVAAGLPAVSRDGKTYTFTIRRGYHFSTGAPVTAANYVRAITRVLDPVMKSPAAKYLRDVSHVDAKGNKLIIRLTTRAPDLPSRMTMPYLCPVPKDLPVDPEGVGAPLPGSGPYYYAEFVRGSRVVLKRNRFYRGTRAHHVDGFIVEVGNPPLVTSQKVEAGELDVDLNVPLPRLPELGKKYKVNGTRLFAVPSPNLFYLYMNTERPLFAHNAKLRRAVSFAIDRPAMVAGFGVSWAGSVSDDYLPPGVPGYVDAHLYPNKHPSVKNARALARGRTRSGEATMYACDSIVTGCLENAQTIKSNLEAIGIDVTIEQFPLTVYAAKVRTRGLPFDLFFDKVIVPWVDPYQYVNMLLDGRKIQASDNTNRSFFNSPGYNKLMDRAASLSGKARYLAYGRLAVDIAQDAAPIVTAFVRNTRFFVSQRVGCVGVSAHGFDLAGLCLK